MLDSTTRYYLERAPACIAGTRAYRNLDFTYTDGALTSVTVA